MSRASSRVSLTFGLEDTVAQSSKQMSGGHGKFIYCTKLYEFNEKMNQKKWLGFGFGLVDWLDFFTVVRVK